MDYYYGLFIAFLAGLCLGAIASHVVRWFVARQREAKLLREWGEQLKQIHIHESEVEEPPELPIGA
jgi:hypothetical protein